MLHWYLESTHHFKKNTNKHVEKVQKSFTRYIYYRTREPYAEYECRLTHVKIGTKTKWITLEQRQVDLRYTRSSICFEYQFHFWRKFCLKKNYHNPNRAKIVFNSSFIRLQTIYNWLFQSYNVLNESRKKFKSIFKKALNLR